MTIDTVKEVVKQNKTFKKENVATRLQQRLLSRIEQDNTKVLFWLNPAVNVSCKGKFVPAIGIRSTAIEDFAQVSIREVSNFFKQVTDNKTSISMMYADEESCTLKDLKQRTTGKAKMAKGFKVPMSLLEPELVEKIKVCCGLKDMEDECAAGSSEEVAQPQNPEDRDIDVFSEQLRQIDETLLNCLKDCGNDESSNPADDSQDETCTTGMFAENLTPNSKKEWSSYSPHSRKTFMKGFELAKRLTAPAADDCHPPNVSTPSTSADQDTSAGTRKRLFSPGCIGVLPRHGKSKPGHMHDDEEANILQGSNSETAVCAACKKESPFKRKSWSGIWIQCDSCNEWYHQECSKLTAIPGEQETWNCQKCNVKEKKTRKN